MSTRYDYSDLKANGIIPTKVLVNGIQIFRLIANGKDIIHKYNDLIVFKLTPQCILYTDTYLTCGDYSAYVDVRSVWLTLKWNSYKTVSKIVLSNITVSVYGYEDYYTRVSCGVKSIIPLGNAVSLWQSKSLSKTLTYNQTEIKFSFSYSSAMTAEFLCKVANMNITLNGTVYFSDGTTRVISIIEGVLIETHEGGRTYSQEIEKVLIDKEY